MVSNRSRVSLASAAALGVESARARRARGFDAVLIPPNSLCLLPLIAQRTAMVRWFRLVAYCSDPDLAFLA